MSFIIVPDACRCSSPFDCFSLRADFRTFSNIKGCKTCHSNPALSKYRVLLCPSFLAPDNYSSCINRTETSIFVPRRSVSTSRRFVYLPGFILSCFPPLWRIKGSEFSPWSSLALSSLTSRTRILWLNVLFWTWKGFKKDKRVHRVIISQSNVVIFSVLQPEVSDVKP